MTAVCWYGKEDVRVDNVPGPVILENNDTIVQVTTTAICGSGLNLYPGSPRERIKTEFDRR
jgi:threonine dehydrogenase-like Zn-dependent dehydrogenase